eukprot:TRINITY_DN9571_c0_g1_i4.p2 TRINITY_DN9571_c0_g1~~TRINITY_DN9571_c0_g1_i4.p2  ORF type:complete len:169 (-),score=42.16 TRINITY_DN9571_c0_g1_i4:161-667(-)
MGLIGNMLSVIIAEQTVVQAGPEAFFGFFGVTSALVFANLGSAYGVAKSGVSIAGIAIPKPEAIMKSLVPVIMAGILGIYGLIMSVVLIQRIGDGKGYDYKKGFSHFASGLCCGLSSWAAGYAIGVAGASGVRSNARQPAIFVGLILILIFAEAIGLYGLIVAIIIAK